MEAPPAASSVDISTYDPTNTYTILGRSYEDAYANVPGQHRAIQWVISELTGKSPSTSSPPRVLDIGSGTGKPTAHLLSASGIHVTGIDLTPKMVEVATSLNLPNCTFSIGDARTWEPPPSSSNNAESTTGPYDGVVSFFALLNGVTQSDIRSYLSRSAGWVREGGVYVFGTVPGAGMESARIRWMGRDEIVSSLGTEEILEVMEKAGLEVVWSEVLPFENRGAELGLCKVEDVWVEEQLFVCARKKKSGV